MKNKFRSLKFVLVLLSSYNGTFIKIWISNDFKNEKYIV